MLGRFVSRDPMGYDAGDVNLYRLVGNMIQKGYVLRLWKKTLQSMTLKTCMPWGQVFALMVELILIKKFNGIFKTKEECEQAGQKIQDEAYLAWVRILEREDKHDNDLSPGKAMFGRRNYEEFFESYNAGLCNE